MVVGFVETHGRPRTARGPTGTSRSVPRKVVLPGIPVRGDGSRRGAGPQARLALVDELAHTNVPGSGRHEKRWEDVLELLDAGIDVITTVNVQHLESIADAVERMTEVHVRERVPDWVVAQADQIELIDSSPEALRRRMMHGNIYPPEKIPKPSPTSSAPRT